MTILPKENYILNVIPIKTAAQFFREAERSVFSFIWKHKTPMITKTILAGSLSHMSTVPQSNSNKNSMAFAYKQTH